MKVSMRLVWLLVPAAMLACVFTASADARSRGPCIPGQARPICYHWKGVVTHVADGDTFDVRVRGAGQFRVRVASINAMELTHYSTDPSQRRGECHAVTATNRLENLIGGRRVRLSAQDPASSSGNRKRRSVAIWMGGKWTDVGQILINEGHAFFLAGSSEWAHNRHYSRGAQVAARNGANLWDTDYCGSGPEDGARLRMWVNWDADGSDSPRKRGEWARIKNVGSSDVSIGGWWFRDSSLRRYRFPAGAVIPAGRSIRVIVGRRPSWDSDRQTRFYWPQSSSVFENVSSRGLGDGGYLFDSQGDLRLWMMYPCRISCGDFLKGKVTVRAHPRAPEKVYVRNVSGVDVNLEGYVVENDPYIWNGPAGTVLHPGEVLTLIVWKSRPDSRLLRYWGKGKYILNDGGDRVLVRTQRNIRIHCHAWGGWRC
jgi:endonuclease YncB( thermonuclease family)